jgi:polar amino acid transport system ATP-binding protein
MIEIADLWKAFGPVQVLKGVSLRVERGSVVAIIGPSGSGKSTLLRCVNLLEDPDRGRIRVGGREMRFGEGAQGTKSPPKPATASSRRFARRPAWCSSISTCSRT